MFEVLVQAIKFGRIINHCYASAAKHQFLSMHASGYPHHVPEA